MRMDLDQFVQLALALILGRYTSLLSPHFYSATTPVFADLFAFLHTDIHVLAFVGV